jgi:hypothetical protein
MVSYHFPPSGGVAAQRPAKFARYLGDFGWEALVLSRVPDPRQPLDDSLGAGPAPFERLDPVEPSRLLGLLPRTLGDALRSRCCIPDEEGGWRRLLRRRLPGILRDRRPDVVWANSVPNGTLVAAAEAARDAHIPFVADFHNEWTRNPYFRPPNASVAARHSALEDFVVRTARRVVTLNPLHTEELRARYPGLACDTIENGFDSVDYDVAPPDPSRRPRVFTYAGAVYGHQSPGPFLRALAGSGLSDVEVRVVGDRFGSFAPGSWPFPVRAEGHLAHRRLGEVFSAASAFFLCLETPAARQLPAKLYEYLRAGRPVFAIVPRDGAAARWIAANAAGTSVASEDPSSWAPALRAFVDGLGGWTPPPGREAFERRALAGRLAALLDEARR